MLRLSIIVPHLGDNTSLETTLLSLLENRSSNLEIIVIHNGTYTDPYNLADDEVTLLEAPRHCGPAEQINLGMAAARSQAVQVLFPGVEVESQWYASAIERLESGVACVASPCRLTDTGETVWGLDRSALPRRRMQTSRGAQVSPMLCGSIFDRHTFFLVGGLCTKLGREGAEVELQLLFDAMELQFEVSDDVRIAGSQRSVFGLEVGYESGRICGQIACAYGAVEGSGVAVDTLAKQLSHLAGGLMSPKSVAERLGWVMGVRDRTYEAVVRERLLTAADRLDEDADRRVLVRPESEQTQTPARRAA